METTTAYKDFDLPTKHLEEAKHFVPAKARDEAEIARRRSLVPGTLLAEHQERGGAVAATIIKLLDRPNDISFGARVLSAAGLNTAWYSFARGAENEVMRRRLKLPFLAAHQPLAEDSPVRPTTDDLLQEAAFGFGEARATGAKIIDSLGHLSPRIERLRKTFGRQVGRASLTLACVELGDMLQNSLVSSIDTQSLVRSRCLQALEDARSLSHEVGLPPSIAQLADPDSHLSVYWRREAPNGAAQAYHQAVELHLAA